MIKQPLEAKRRQKQPPLSKAQAVRQQIAWAAGSEAFDYRDPLYHVTEDFHQTFDAIGQRHAAALAGETVGGFQPSSMAQQAMPPDQTDARQLYQTRDPAKQDMVRRFSETAFQRGTLSGAVLQGTGKMMLVSCLKRTVGQSEPTKEQQRRLFEGSSQQRNAASHTPDAVVFNRGFACSAVGLVVDTLRDARRVVDSMANLAEGKSNMGDSGGAETLQKMYPFLDTSREETLLAEYAARLRSCTDPAECSLLQNAQVRVQALKQKKEQMRQEFINKLRLISDRAAEALTLFEAPGLPAELAEMLAGETAGDDGDTPEPEGDEDDAPPNSEDGT